jgi:hypothetical protein
MQARDIFEAVIEARQKLKDAATVGDCKDTEVILAL